jgi:hypothetical protein
VRLIESGQSIAAAARSLGVVEQTLSNWVRAVSIVRSPLYGFPLVDVPDAAMLRQPARWRTVLGKQVITLRLKLKQLYIIP